MGSVNVRVSAQAAPSKSNWYTLPGRKLPVGSNAVIAPTISMVPVIASEAPKESAIAPSEASRITVSVNVVLPVEACVKM